MKQISILLLLMLNSQFINSQPMAQQMDLKELGVRFEIPEGWTGGVQGEYMLLGHESIPGMMILFQNNGKTVEELKSVAMQGIMNEGVALSPTDDFEIVNNQRVEGNYEGSYDGMVVKAFAAGLINDLGSGLSLLILTETDKFSNVHAQEAHKLLETVSFYKPVSENNEQLQFWKDRLMGKMLKFMLTRSSNDFNGGQTGYNENRTINFCVDGRFNYYSNSHASIDTGTNAGGFLNDNGNYSGQYEISGSNDRTWLKLDFENGEVYEAELTTDDQRLKTFIDGSRYYLAGDAECQ